MRREKVVTIRDRERSLSFKIREMPATQADRWVTRAILLIGSGKDLAKFISQGGLATEEQLGALFGVICSGVSFEKAQPMLEELLRCCTRLVDGIEQPCTSEIIDGYVEDWQTIKKLQWEALKLMFDFFQDANPLNSGNPATTESVQSRNQDRPPIRMSAG